MYGFEAHFDSWRERDHWIDSIRDVCTKMNPLEAVRTEFSNFLLSLQVLSTSPRKARSSRKSSLESAPHQIELDDVLQPPVVHNAGSVPRRPQTTHHHSEEMQIYSAPPTAAGGPSSSLPQLAKSSGSKPKKPKDNKRHPRSATLVARRDHSPEASKSVQPSPDQHHSRTPSPAPRAHGKSRDVSDSSSSPSPVEPEKHESFVYSHPSTHSAVVHEPRATVSPLRDNEPPHKYSPPRTTTPFRDHQLQAQLQTERDHAQARLRAVVEFVEEARLRREERRTEERIARAYSRREARVAHAYGRHRRRYPESDTSEESPPKDIRRRKHRTPFRARKDAENITSAVQTTVRETITKLLSPPEKDSTVGDLIDSAVKRRLAMERPMPSENASISSPAPRQQVSNLPPIDSASTTASKTHSRREKRKKKKSKRSRRRRHRQKQRKPELSPSDHPTHDPAERVRQDINSSLQIVEEVLQRDREMLKKHDRRHKKQVEK